MATIGNDKRNNDHDAEDQEGRCRSDLGACAQELERGRWKAFLDEFSHNHSQDPVSVEIRGETSGGAHWLSHESPLLGLVAGDEGNAGSVEIILGGSDSGPLAHTVRGVQKVWRQQNEQGREVVQMVANDGTTVVVTLVA